MTHRAVDDQAGLPQGSCSSAFRTRLALLTALTHQVGHVLTVEILALAETLTGAEAALELSDQRRRLFVIDELTVLFARLISTPGLVVVQAELALEAQRQPALQEVLGAWRDRLLAIVEAIIRGACKPNPRERAVTVVAALEGVALAGLQIPEGQRADYLRTAVTLLIGGLDEPPLAM